MNTILIGYDLNTPGQDYDSLHEAIKALGAWWHHLDSTWLVKTSLSTSDVHGKLKPTVGSDDELLVINVTGQARAWSGFNESGSKWLKETYA
ncbi:hypothetical protein MPY17_13960 [Rhodococcus opacus]|uniref:hypothetical protein n=1 Tax=Rhodococcus opacus TaxID=37919 RepID=UPI001FF3E7A8|nr:hypothetical protein [Rhodococcus opacus]UOT06774.1 hypothetical protein MPY17_13960 [Rhodococcus opacus]